MLIKYFGYGKEMHNWTLLQQGYTFYSLRDCTLKEVYQVERITYKLKLQTKNI